MSVIERITYTPREVTAWVALASWRLNTSDAEIGAMVDNWFNQLRLKCRPCIIGGLGYYDTPRRLHITWLGDV
jgi:hypothetical protein